MSAGLTRDGAFADVAAARAEVCWPRASVATRSDLGPHPRAATTTSAVTRASRDLLASFERHGVIRMASMVRSFER